MSLNAVVFWRRAAWVRRSIGLDSLELLNVSLRFGEYSNASRRVGSLTWALPGTRAQPAYTSMSVNYTCITYATHSTSCCSERWPSNTVGSLWHPAVYAGHLLVECRLLTAAALQGSKYAELYLRMHHGRRISSPTQEFLTR